MNAKDKLFAFCEERGLRPCWFTEPTRHVPDVTSFRLEGVGWLRFMRWAGGDDMVSPDATPFGKDRKSLGNIAASYWHASIGVGNEVGTRIPKHLFVSLFKSVGVVPSWMMPKTELGRLAAQKCIEATGWTDEAVSRVLESFIPELTGLYIDAMKEAIGE